MIWAMLFQQTASTKTRPFIRQGKVAHIWKKYQKNNCWFSCYTYTGTCHFIEHKSLISEKWQFFALKWDFLNKKPITYEILQYYFYRLMGKMCLSGENSGNKIVHFWLQVSTRQGWHKYPIFQLHKCRSSKQNYQVRSHSGSFF